MKYKISLTPHARNDFSYMSLIRFQAKDILYVINQIKTLSSSPRLGPLVNKQSFFDYLSLRYLKANNYIIYYAIDETTHTIEVYSIDIENITWQKSLSFKTNEIISECCDFI